MKKIGKDGRRRSEWPKSDLRYWQDVVFRPKYPDRGEARESEFYVVRIAHEGRRTTFPLATSNKAAAAETARNIYQVILINGWEAAYALAKKHTKRPCPVTVGEFLAEARKHLEVRARTFGGYCRSLRKIVSDIFELDPGNSKFDYQGAGHSAWLARVDAIKLESITPEKVHKWRSQFVERANGDEVKRRSAKISATTFLREAKALFAPDVLNHFEGVKSPFDRIKVSERISTRYRSQVPDLEALVSDACRELNTDERRECFKVFLLAVYAGLRRSEIDLLEWDAFDLKKPLLRIQATKHFTGKSESSLSDIPLDEEMAEFFRGLKTRTTSGGFVIKSASAPKAGASYSHYRCQGTFDQLIEWLRAKGITSRSPLHVLRKEFGSAIAQEHGIFAASRALRHSSVAVTESHYATQKRPVSIGLGHVLTDNVVSFTPKKHASDNQLDVQGVS
jgi:integrase